MSSENIPRWYVVQTHINGEAKAMSNLMRQGFEVYLPRYLKRRSHARTVDTVARPLFPRYLFVAIDLATQRWRSIQSTIGVSHLVSWGGTPASVHDGVISALKEREDEGGFVRLERRVRFSPGDKVRVLEGAFIDSLACVEGVNDRERVAILLDFLGRKVRVLVGADLIAAA
jgi:transcriptional antiterminator RfaH